jgi:endonuclease-3
MNVMDIPAMIAILRRLNQTLDTPALGIVHERWRDPFRTLISCILSLRTQDKTTRAASMRLFELADTPYKMFDLNEEVIRNAIYPVGFYRRKAAVIREVCKDLIDRFESRVPDNLEALLSLNGVGRKTANLVLTVVYGKPGICVDTHVHRIVNRWGYVKTRTAEQTEMALREKLPKEYWIEFNDLLVPFGQNICVPISPFCSTCPLYDHCLRVGVTRTR